MPQLSTSYSDPALRTRAHNTYRTVDAFDAVAWRPPEPRRFDSRPANDWRVVPESEFDADAIWADGVPRWLVILIGAVCAAVMGALLGGALAL